MKSGIAICLMMMLMCLLIAPAEREIDAEAVLLARAIYAIAGEEDYEAKLSVGTVVMNRVDSRFFPDTTEEVLYGQHAFPMGENFDDDSLDAAYEVLDGYRAFDEDVLWYRMDGTMTWGTEGYVCEEGSLAFYNADGFDL